MIINNEKWDEIVAATRAGIERWKAAAERDCKDTFSCDVHDRGGYVVLMTMHQSDRTERHALAREHVGGEDAGPESIARMADKPAGEIVALLGGSPSRTTR